MEKPKKTKKKVSWAKAQLIGFWSIVALMSAFWFGTFVGTQATLNSQAHEAEIKAQAIEEYQSKQ